MRQLTLREPAVQVCALLTLVALGLRAYGMGSIAALGNDRDTVQRLLACEACLSCARDHDLATVALRELSWMRAYTSMAADGLHA